MRRRICLMGAAISAGPLAVGVAIAPAAKPKSHAAKPVASTCTVNVSTSIPAGATTLDPPVDQGSQYGSIACGRPFRMGAQVDHFQVADSGDTVGPFTMYFATGSIHGTLDLTPTEGPAPGVSFIEVDYTGTLTVTGGTGAYRKAGGSGTLTCKSPDEVHMTCTDRLKLTKL